MQCGIDTLWIPNKMRLGTHRLKHAQQFFVCADLEHHCWIRACRSVAMLSAMVATHKQTRRWQKPQEHDDTAKSFQTIHRSPQRDEVFERLRTAAGDVTENGGWALMAPHPSSDRRGSAKQLATSGAAQRAQARPRRRPHASQRWPLRFSRRIGWSALEAPVRRPHRPPRSAPSQPANVLISRESEIPMSFRVLNSWCRRGVSVSATFSLQLHF